MANDKNEIGDTVGHILAVRQAIDMTPILYIILTENVSAGRTLRIDRGDLKVTVEDLATNA